MSKLVIGVDCDGVLRNFSQSLYDTYRKYNPSHWAIPPSEQNLYPLDSFYQIGKGIQKFAFQEHADEIYLKASPYKGAYHFMRRLHKDHKVLIVSYQPTPHIEDLTRKWLDNESIENDGIIFIKRKQDVPLYILLDDCTTNLESLTHTQGVTIDRPWNRDWKGPRVYDFDEFLHYVKIFSEGNWNEKNNSKDGRGVK